MSLQKLQAPQIYSVRLLGSIESRLHVQNKSSLVLKQPPNQFPSFNEVVDVSDSENDRIRRT